MKNKDTSQEKKESKVDPEKLEKIKEIFQLIANTFAVMKIFPIEHSSVRKFVDELDEKMKKFLDEYEALEIGIEGYSFTHEGEVVHRDENPTKSLQFLLLKDGVQMLFFFKGLEKQEIQDLLEILKKDSLLPPEESDIVSLLWARDFANIRYIAPDDFLETKIGMHREPIEVKIKPSEAKFDLTPEDKTAVGKGVKEKKKKGGKGKDQKKAQLAQGISAEGEDKEEMPKVVDFVSRIASLDEKEIKEIDSMISSDRQISPEEDFLNLIIEMLYLEERLEQFQATLKILEQNLKDTLQKGDFSQASLLLNSVQELEEIFTGQSKEKAELLDKFIKNAKDESSLAILKDLALGEQIKNFNSFFEYLKFLGQKTMPFIADLFEETKHPDFRSMALNSLKEISQNDMALLVNMAHEKRPSYTREIISHLDGKEIKRTLPYFVNFINSKNKAIKLEAINALGKIEDEQANKILLGFLADGEDEVRTKALENMKFLGDKVLVEQMMQIAANKAFSKKNVSEKKAILNFLGKSRTDEACDFLQNILKKSSLFFNPKQNETRLCAVSALEVMATPRAAEVLKAGTKLRNKKIREACESALDKIEASNTPPKSLNGEQSA